MSIELPDELRALFNLPDQQEEQPTAHNLQLEDLTLNEAELMDHEPAQNQPELVPMEDVLQQAEPEAGTSNTDPSTPVGEPVRRWAYLQQITSPDVMLQTLGREYEADVWPILCARQEIPTFSATINFAMEELRAILLTGPETVVPYQGTRQAIEAAITRVARFITTNELTTYCQPYLNYNYPQVVELYLKLIGEWLRMHQVLPAHRQNNEIPLISIFQPTQDETDIMRNEGELEKYQALRKWTAYVLTTLNGRFRKLQCDRLRNQMLQQGTNDYSCAVAQLRIFSHVNHRLIDDLRLNTKINGHNLHPINVENDVVENHGNRQAEDYRSWDTQRIKEICTREQYRNIITPYDALEAIHRHYSNWCRQYHNVVIRGNSYALFAAPHVTNINELRTDQRPLAKQLFIGFWRVLQYTQSVFTTFAEQNPVCRMNLEYLNSIELTPPDYANVREEFIFGTNADADGTYARPNPADVTIRRPAAPSTPRRVNQPPPRAGQAAMPINPPINVGPIPPDFMNLASLQ